MPLLVSIFLMAVGCIALIIHCLGTISLSGWEHGSREQYFLRQGSQKKEEYNLCALVEVGRLLCALCREEVVGLSARHLEAESAENNESEEGSENPEIRHSFSDKDYREKKLQG